MVFKAHEKNIRGWEGGVKTIQPREGALSLTFALKSLFQEKGWQKGQGRTKIVFMSFFQIKFIEHQLPVRVKVRFSLKMKRRIQCS